MATKKSRKHVSHNKTHILLKKGLLVYALVVFLLFILVSLSALVIAHTVQAYGDHQRLTRIQQIYESLELDDSYRMADADIFGDKRVYEWDTSRTYASAISYGRNADRTETFKDLKKQIEAAGFEQINGPNYGEVARQDHYRSVDGEYIRVSIDTRAMYDSMLYGTDYPKPGSDAQIENGPVYITIKVNLDDNNE